MAKTVIRAARSTRYRGLIAAGSVFVLVILLIVLWDWDWFIPFVERQASATVGRKVTLQHLHVHLGRVTHIVADDVTIAGTADLPKPLATLQHLTVNVEAYPLIRHFQIVLPLIDLDNAVVSPTATASGANNWTLKPDTPTPPSSKKNTDGAPTLLGILQIENGIVHVDDAKLKAKFDIKVKTRNTPDPDLRPIPANQGEIVADARGTYAGQRVVGHFIGGAILSLRDKTKPYPIDLKLANGPTHVSLVGTLEQPLSFGGARLKLLFAGPDMSLLFPLTGVPIPQTAPYSVTGSLDYAKQRIKFENFQGRVGASDLGGTITVLPSKVPSIDADLHSHNVDLSDLGGFIGSKPGRSANTTSTPSQNAAVAGTKSDGNVLPTTPINLPKIRAANIRLVYKGDHIENRSVPLDNIVARLDIQDGDIDLKQLDFKVGTGTIFSTANLDPSGNTLRTRAHVDFHKLDLSRLMQATHAFHGQGVIGGRADLTTTGNSFAAMLGNGDGGLSLVLSGGGDISALLPDIAGLEFGNALLSALGLPNRAQIQCFIVDMPLKNGILSTNSLLLQTSEARTVGNGTVDFHDQTLHYSLTTRSTHFSIGSLPGPINITGKLGKPAIAPGAEVVARAGAAAGLGVVLPPLALLPTIQLGVGEGGACQAALTNVKAHPAAPPHHQVVRPGHPSTQPRHQERKAL